MKSRLTSIVRCAFGDDLPPDIATCLRCISATMIAQKSRAAMAPASVAVGLGQKALPPPRSLWDLAKKR